MKKIMHILTGWGKKLGIIQISNVEEKLSELRLKKCMRCPHADVSKILTIINGHGEQKDIIYCKLCACPCVQKSLVVDEKCPIDKW